MQKLALLMVSCALGANACNPDTGKLAAEKTGDMTFALQADQRVAPDGELVAACGDGVLTEAGRAAIQRHPYLQEVTTDSAVVMLTSVGDQPAIVDVARPDGTAIASVETENDGMAAGGAWQGAAHLSGLEPDTIYCYSIRDLTEPAGFRTAPAPGTGRPVRFIAFGDSGSGNGNQHALLGEMHTVPFDLILHTGDIAYEDGTLGEYEGNVFGVYRELFKSFSFWPASGNHDYATAGAAVFRQVFMLPDDGTPERAERWYSFNWGDVHFVALDTELIGAQQAQWLEADLASNVLPWVVVYGHRPPYSSGDHGSDMGFRQTFVPVLERHRVQLVLSGHDHDYERTRAINGVTYVVTGAGGKSTRSVGSSWFTAFSEDATHFVYADVEGTSLTLHAIDGVGREFDSARISL